MSQGSRRTAQSFPGMYASSTVGGEFATATHVSGDGPRRASFHHYPRARRSLASRVSQSIATRLSIVGLRETPRTGTVIGVTINTLCNVMGAGVLALPLATRNASVGLALLVLAFVATLSAYAVYCLAAACDATGRFSVTEVTAFSLFPPRSFDVFCASLQDDAHTPPARSGPSAAGTMTGPALTTSEFHTRKLQHARDELRRRRWRRIVTVAVECVILCTNFGSLTIYARVIADSMPPVVGNVCHELDVTPLPLLVHEVFWLAISGITFFVLSCARNMEELKWTSLLGFLTIFYVVVLVLYRYHTASWSSDPEKRQRGFPSIDPEQRGRIDWFSVPATALRTVSAYGVAFGYHFNVPYFYLEIGNRVPSEMMKTVALSFPVIVGCYGVTGVFGYLTFGELVASAHAGGNIVMNYPEKDVLVNVGRLGLFAHFACVFPIVSLCARRGLHRLLMMMLKWTEQSALMEIEVVELEEEEETRQRNAHQRHERRSHGDGRDSPSDAVEHGEQTPLLTEPVPPHPARYVTADGMHGQTEAGHVAGEPAVVEANAFPHGIDPAELDHDVGSPEDTTRLAIGAEAFLLVSGAVLLAATVSGIGLVIDVIGCLFGLFLILIVPGVVGMCVFSTHFLMNRQGSSREEGSVVVEAGVRFARIKQWLCAVCAVTGVVITVVSTSIFAMDHLPRTKQHR